MGDEGEFDIDALLEAPYVKEVKWGDKRFRFEIVWTNLLIMKEEIGWNDQIDALELQFFGI